MVNRKAISKRVRFTIFERDGYRCQYCGATAPDAILHLDHITAVANGGTNDPENLRTACADCNLGKGVLTVSYAPRTGTLVCPFADGWPQDITDPVFYVQGDWAVTGYAQRAAD